jgi:hypothetical protein
MFNGNIVPDTVIVPGRQSFELPERVLHFCTAILLRGLPDYFLIRLIEWGFSMEQELW